MAAPYKPDGSSGRAKRLTEPQIQILVKDVVTRMTSGQATRTIMDHYDSIGYTSAQIRLLLERAAFAIKEQYKDSVATIYERSLNRLEMLYQTAIQKGNLKVAVEAQKEIDRISGLYSNRLEITADINIPQVIRVKEIVKDAEGSGNTSDKNL